MVADGRPCDKRTDGVEVVNLVDAMGLNPVPVEIPSEPWLIRNRHVPLVIQWIGDRTQMRRRFVVVDERMQ